MIRGIESILLNSAGAEKLAKFYKDIVGLKQTGEFEMGDGGEKAIMFELGDVTLAILDHSKVKGKNKTPERFIINFEVSDIEKEFKRLTKAGVKVQQDIYHVEGYGLIATFIDPEGNFFQTVQIKATN